MGIKKFTVAIASAAFLALGIPVGAQAAPALTVQNMRLDADAGGGAVLSWEVVGDTSLADSAEAGETSSAWYTGVSVSARSLTLTAGQVFFPITIYIAYFDASSVYIGGAVSTFTDFSPSTDPCVINPQSDPSCPGYVPDDPCVINPQSDPSCPGYVPDDPCVINPQSDVNCPGYAGEVTPVFYTRYDFGGKTHYYAYFGKNLSYAEAETWANSRTFNGVSGHLPTITSRDENNAMRLLVREIDDPVWLGLKDTTYSESGTPPRTWKWQAGPENGTLVTSCTTWLEDSSGCTNDAGVFTRWNGGEPNNSTFESVAEMYWSGRWNDTSSDGSRNTVFEYTLDGIAPEEDLATPGYMPFAPYALPADDFTVAAAAARSDVLFDTGSNKDQVHVANGSQWYFNGNVSWGFTPRGATVYKDDCDGGDMGWADGANYDDGGGRLCWHTGSDALRGGYRAGLYTNLNNSESTYRAIYTSDMPTYYPSGPQPNVSQQTLADGGWTLCFSEYYGEEGSKLSDILAACDGDYLLLAGMAGSNSWTPAVEIATAPDAPTGVKAIAGDGEATVSWTAPADNGGADITGYTVTASTGETCTTDGALSCIVTGLENYTFVTFTVTATNSAGTSDGSEASLPVVPHTSELQVWIPNQTVVRDTDAQIWIFGVTSSSVFVRVGLTPYTLNPDEGGVAVITYTADWTNAWVRTGRMRVAATMVVTNPDDGSIETVKATNFFYIPRASTRAKWYSGRDMTVRVRAAAPESSLSFKINGEEVCTTDADDRGRASCTFAVPEEVGDYTVETWVGDLKVVSTDFTVAAASRRAV